jgi:type VI secretion system protein ImpK
MPSTDNDSLITASYIDTVLQDTWLLALAIRNRPQVEVDDELYKHCFSMIEDVQNTLKAAGVSDYLAGEIKAAHCIFLDEAVMTQPDTDVSVWWRRTPLQGHFLGHLHGGDLFYENIKKLLREAAPSEAIMTCYYRMLLLGYTGKLRSEENEERQSLMKQLRERLPAVAEKTNSQVFIHSTRPDIRFWRRSPWVMSGLVLLFIVAASCAMNAHLHYQLGQWFTPG